MVDLVTILGRMRTFHLYKYIGVNVFISLNRLNLPSNESLHARVSL